MQGAPGTTMDVVSLLDALPFFAMILDAHHNVIEANTWFAAEALSRPNACPLSCHEVLHGTDEPPFECPLGQAVRTGRPAEVLLGDVRHGLLRVSVYPLGQDDRHGELYLHLAQLA